MIDYSDAVHPRFDKMYASLPEEDHKSMPKGESLEMVRERIEPYWNEQILPTLKTMKGGSSILFSAHEHVLRGMVQFLAGLDNEQILSLRLPNGAPFVFEFEPSVVLKTFDMPVELEPTSNYYIDDKTVSVYDKAEKDDAKLQ